MALFDFLKPSRIISQAIQAVSSISSECDTGKTIIVAELLQIPRALREDKWHHDFYQNIGNAAFAAASPQVLTGPDGFPYFILTTPEPGKPFQSFCIQNMKDDFLLEKGWGIVFNPAKDKSADWVFTHGDIVNFHLNNTFFTPTEESTIENIEFTKTVGVLKKDEQVMIAQPSEEYLPAATRFALKTFLQSKGIKRPKLLLLSSYNKDKVIRKLAFNIHPEDYPVATKLDYLMQQVGWFLPNDYIIIPLPKNSSLAKGFNDL